MENASRALEMAAGVLLAVLILSLLAFFFSSISQRPVDDDLRVSAEQLAKFNQEYEVYQKSAMYGVDVISCLNKAISNNEKYVQEKGFFEGSKYDENYLIEVQVSFQTPLSESTELYALDMMTLAHDTTKEEYQETIISGSISHPSFSGVGITIDGSKMLTNYKSTDRIGTTSGEIDLDSNEDSENPNYVSLLHDSEHRIERLAKLDLEKTVSNRSGNYRSSDSGGWTRFVWKTVLDDVKRRKFKCTYIGYSGVTGRVNELRFSEIRSQSTGMVE